MYPYLKFLLNLSRCDTDFARLCQSPAYKMRLYRRLLCLFRRVEDTTAFVSTRFVKAFFKPALTFLPVTHAGLNSGKSMQAKISLCRSMFHAKTRPKTRLQKLQRLSKLKSVRKFWYKNSQISISKSQKAKRRTVKTASKTQMTAGVACKAS